jgi:hypothetical protein
LKIQRDLKVKSLTVYFDEALPPVKAWKKKNSGVYKLLNFESDIAVPTKGYDCDWPPHIGKIE